MNKDVINRYLGKLGVELHGKGYLQSLAKGEFKQDAFDVQQRIMTGNSVKMIFDIGANRGDVTVRYTSLFPDAVIHAFEPFPGSYNILEERTAGNNKVNRHCIALADKPGKSTFYVNVNVDTNSLLKPRAAGLTSDSQVANKTQIEVEVGTIDIFCNNNGIDNIDILKLDIQGGELAALKGAEALLRQKKIGLIYSETYFVAQYEGHPLFHDISKFLEQAGYHIQDFYNPIYGNGSIAWCDAIFLPKR